ncbi:MAG TPA: 3-hydroxyacyl-CoA dehydrogenase NAD-binding domain-containing protein, partial [Candidatus Baltobacteraceae bacterium]|nr:3-hydroxyacyl-CoA dehydrogenase NAD-binding domain-containing protein [Candidatus Baltobacteraceae bacterium]
DAAPEALERARTAIERILETARTKGRLSEDDVAARRKCLELGGDLPLLAASDIVVEAVFESLELKRAIFAELDQWCAPSAVLATNTSTLDVDAIAAAASHPERSLGMHFFSPAHVMRLLEIVRGAETSAATLATAIALGKRLGKVPVVVGNCDGFVGNRMLLKYRREAEFLVLAGATPEQVDGALVAFGFAMGPFAVADLAGIDVGVRAKEERRKRGTVLAFALTNLSDELVAAGRLGQKTGAGYYRYEPGERTAHPDPALAPFIARERERLGITLRTVDDTEIVERCVYALANEGARILAEGIASSAADIDTIWVNGYGFPAARGGPMRHALDTGLPRVAEAIRRFAQSDPGAWDPAALESLDAKTTLDQRE